MKDREGGGKEREGVGGRERGRSQNPCKGAFLPPFKWSRSACGSGNEGLPASQNSTPTSLLDTSVLKGNKKPLKEQPYLQSYTLSFPNEFKLQAVSDNSTVV